jgi:hypothetical protein
MSENNNGANNGSAPAGSPDALIQPGPTGNMTPAGEPKSQTNEQKVNLEDYVPKTQFAEL